MIDGIEFATYQTHIFYEKRNHIGGLYEKILENAIDGGASLWAFDAS